MIKRSSFENDSLIRISNWHVMLPFYPDTLLPVLERQNQDFFQSFGSSENEIKNLQDFLSLSEKTGNDLILGTINIPLYIFDFSKIENFSPPMSCYLATTIKSHAQLSAVITMSAYQSCKLWVNGELVYISDWKRGRSKYREDFVPVNLKKGGNFVMVKLTVSDMDYQPAQWRFEADITNESYAKYLFNTEFRRYFIKNSLIAPGESLKLYAGPYENGKIIVFEDSNAVIDQDFHIHSFNRSISIDLSNLNYGLHRCKMIIGSSILEQDFFYGDLDEYYEEKEKEYKKIANNLTEIEQSNFEMHFKRLYVESRREKGAFYSLREYWNRIRVPTMKMLNKALKDPGNVHSYFIRTYESEYLKQQHRYSAYVPVNQNKMPVFIILDYQEKIMDDWTDHWRTFNAHVLDPIIDLADDLGFIPVWTDCGGGLDADRLISVFNEIYNDVINTLPVDTNQIFLIGICESAPLSLSFLHHYPTKFRGCGLVNPFFFESQYLVQKNNYNHRLCMIYSYHDEVVPNELSLIFFRDLKRINSESRLFTIYNSTHYNCTKEYYKPVFTYLINSD